MRPPTRPGLFLAIALAVVALPTAASGALSSPATTTAVAANSATYTDSTGEDPRAPDMTSIAVSNTDAGVISFKIGIPNRPQLTQDMDFEVYIDTDNKTSTGNQDFVPGADYLIQVFRGEPILWKWNGTDFSRSFGNPPSVTLRTSYSTGPLIQIAASELGNTKRLKFLVFAVSGITFDPVTGDPDFSNAPVDTAPNYGSGLYEYEVKTAPARLVVKSLKPSPARPSAGRSFTLRLVATRSDTGAAVQNGRVTCVGRAGTARLKAQVQRVQGGAAVCTWTLPASTKGKTFRGSVAVVFEGLKASQSYAGKIR